VFLSILKELEDEFSIKLTGYSSINILKAI
jgi:hypothetical protein